jgi:phosphonate transport system substrate-binding protein
MNIVRLFPKTITVITKLSVFSAMVIFSASAIANNYNPNTLKIALLPDENAATIIQDNKPFAAFLETNLNKKVELIVTTDYSSMIEAARFGRIDVAYFGPASYTIAKDKMKGGKIDLEPFAARLKRGSTSYQSVIIADKRIKANKIADLKGTNLQVAFGDQASTSSHFAPKYTMMKAGVFPSFDYKENFVGAHDAVAKNVERGNAQVGGLSLPIFKRLIKRKLLDADKIKVLGYSDPLPQYPWVMRTDLTLALKESIRKAFFSLKKGTKEGDAVLKPFKADGFGKITDSDYDIIRDIRKNVSGG